MVTRVISLRQAGLAERARIMEGREPGVVYIGRPSKWGNPFVEGRDGSREEVISKFKTYMMEQSPLLWGDLAELVGKKLACWCKPLDCHGDVLADWAEAYETFVEHVEETQARIKARR